MKFQEMGCIKKWDEVLSTKFTEDDWEAIFLLPFSVTSDINIRWFQFRLIHRILGTNSYLYKINYVENSICTFCKQFPETIEHIFWTCRYSQALIRNMLLNHHNIYGDLTLNDMLFGFIESACKMKNLLLIFFKMYIFKCRNVNVKPSIQGAKNYMYLTFQYKILKNKLLLSEKHDESIGQLDVVWSPFIDMNCF